jgi:hypothetical protein
MLHDIITFFETGSLLGHLACSSSWCSFFPDKFGTTAAHVSSNKPEYSTALNTFTAARASVQQTLNFWFNQTKSSVMSQMRNFTEPSAPPRRPCFRKVSVLTTTLLRHAQRHLSHLNWSYDGHARGRRCQIGKDSGLSMLLKLAPQISHLAEERWHERSTWWLSDPFRGFGAARVKHREL